jgi:hypothetical protein
MLPKNEYKNSSSVMSRFAPYRIPGSHHLAQGSKHQKLYFSKIPDRSLRVCVVIPVYNEADTLPLVLTEVNALPFRLEIICIINGCQDESLSIARNLGPNIHILEFPDVLGHDLGRVLGAYHAENPDAYLFIDADLVVKAADLAIFVQAVYNGVDAALNDFSRLLGTDALFHPVNICKYFLNLALRLGGLGPSSMTTIPHALSRRAIEAIGYDTLSCPPLALAKIALAGLNIQAVQFVDVITVNKRTLWDHSQDKLTDLIIGDHLEALSYLEKQLGTRAWFPDNVRQRNLLKKVGVLENANS